MGKKLNLKAAFLRAALIFGGVVTALLLAEAFLRLFPDSSPLPRSPEALWTHWLPHMEHTSEQIAANYNEYFVFDREFGYLPSDMSVREAQFIGQPGRRIVLLGDSITASHTYFDQVSAALRLRNPGLELNIFNGGVGGWDTGQEVGYFSSRADVLKPEVVILQFCINDFEPTPIFWRDSDGKFYAFNAGGWSKILSSDLVSYSRIVRKAAFRLFEYFPPDKKLDRSKVLTGFRDIVALSKQKGFTLRIALLPSFGRSIESDLVIHQLVTRVIEELGIQDVAIDLFDLPAKYDTFYWRASKGDWVHPNEEGSAIIAGEISKRLSPLTR